MDNKNNQLSLIALILLSVGSMIGTGVFALPQNIASVTGVGSLAIAWLVTFIGMFSLTLVFQFLSLNRPDLNAGIYSYAKEGLGNYMGFGSAWGYWISAWIGNVAYLMMLSSSLSLFIPILAGETKIIPLIFNSILLWVVTYLCIRGIKTASIINNVVTIIKVIPILIFIGIVMYHFKLATVSQDIWQLEKFGSGASQVKATMLLTTWSFIGIESACVFSTRAARRKDIGRATVYSFIIIFLILALVSILPFGILGQGQLMNLANPSTGAILAVLVGKWGSVLINLGLIISIIGALLAWILLSSEIVFVAAKTDQLFPPVFARQNSEGTPVGALIITGILQQLYLIIAFFYKAGYLATILLATSMILLPYLFSAIYSVIFIIKEKNTRFILKNRFLWINCLAVVYCLWLLYASGLKNLVLSSVLYLLGTLLFIFNRYYYKVKIFTKYELILCIFFSAIACWCMVQLFSGKLTF